MNRIDGKVAVITGAKQGLGAAIAQLFAEAGAAGLVIVDLDLQQGRAKAAEINAATGVPVEMVQADLGDIQQVRQVMPQTDKRFGRVDILVNAAASTARGNLLNSTPEFFDHMFAVNVRAPFFLMQDAVKLMEREHARGTIVNIGTMSERAGQPIVMPYCASKAALSTVTRSSGYALMRNGIRVNQINIGWMNSDRERAIQAEESGDPQYVDKIAPTLPFGRLVQPAEVAKAVLWAASEDSGLMTGSVIHFDQSVWGGYDGQAPGPAEKLTA